METAKHIVIILLLASLTTGTALSEESKISDTLTASCLVKITSDPAILPLDDTTIDYLIHSSGVGGKAARETLGEQLPEEILEEVLRIEWLADEAGIIPPEYSDLGSPSSQVEKTNYDKEMSEYEYEMMMMQNRGESAPDSRRRTSRSRRVNRETISSSPEQMILLRLSVSLDMGGVEKPAAEEFMNAVIDNLKSALAGAFDDYRNRLRGRLELADEEVARTESELRAMQKRVQKIAGSHILDKDRILGEIRDLRQRLQSTKMDQESDKVIVETITKRIAETQANVKEQVANDPVLKEMQQIIERQQQQLARAAQLVKQGITAEETIVEAEQKLSKARIDLAQRKEELSRASGGNQIESLNRQLADRTMREAQNQATIAALNKQLAEEEMLLGKTDDYELLSLRADIVKQNLQEALIWRDRISRQIRLIQPPTVSVLGGE